MKIFSKIKNVSAGEAKKRLCKTVINPYFDWAFIIIGWAVLFIVFSLIGYYIHICVSGDIESNQLGDLKITPLVFEEEKLDSFLSEYAERQDEGRKLLDGGGVGTSDPSM